VRLLDPYREAIWAANINISALPSPVIEITKIERFGGLQDNPDDQVIGHSSKSITSNSHTSGGIDGAYISFIHHDESSTSLEQIHITVNGKIGGYVKILKLSVTYVNVDIDVVALGTNGCFLKSTGVRRGGEGYQYEEEDENEIFDDGRTSDVAFSDIQSHPFILNITRG
jgi:hypothetical protein